MCTVVSAIVCSIVPDKRTFMKDILLFNNLARGVANGIQ